jgi:oligosaccharide repeat unit polymerase
MQNIKLNDLSKTVQLLPIYFICIIVGATIPLLPLQSNFLLALTFAVVLCGGCALIAFIVISGESYLFHPLWILLTSYIIGYLLRSFYIIFIDPSIMIGMLPEEAPVYLAQALLIVIIGILCLCVGYKSSIGLNLAQKLPVFKPNFNNKRVLLIALLFYTIGIYSSFSILGYTGFSWQIESFTQKRQDASVILLTFSRFTTLGVYMHLIYNFSLKRFSLISWLLWLCGTLFVAFFAIYSSSRTNLLGLILVNLILIHHLFYKIKLANLLIALGLVLLLSSAIVGIRNARADVYSTLIESLKITNTAERIVSSRDLADITTVAHIIRHVENTGELRLGETIVTLLTRFIPRSLWPDKPLNVGVEVSDLFFDEALGRRNNTGVPPSIIAELFWNFHIAGVIFGMFIFGITIRTNYEYLRRFPVNPWVVLITASIYLYVLDQSRADISLSVGRLIILMVPMIAAMCVITWRAGSPFIGRTHHLVSPSADASI